MQFSLNKLNSSLHSELYILSGYPVGDLEKAKTIITEEYNKYPKLIKESQIALVNLVSNLKVKNNKDIDKYVGVSATPDPEARWMYIDINYLKDENYFRQCINHEIWHLYDFAMNGTFLPDDPTWQSLNPKSFKYGIGG